MLEQIGQFLIIAGIFTFILSVIRITGIQKMTNTILALLFLLVFAVIAMDLLPGAQALTALIQDLPLIGKILDWGSLYHATQVNFYNVALELLKLCNMIIFVEIITRLMPFIPVNQISIRLLITCITSIIANLLMNLFLDRFFIPIAYSFTSVFGPVYAAQFAQIFGSMFLLFSIVFALYACQSLLHEEAFGLSPSIAVSALIKTFAFFILVLLIDYFFNDSIVAIIHGISSAFTLHGGLWFILSIVLVICWLVLI